MPSAYELCRHHTAVVLSSGLGGDSGTRYCLVVADHRQEYAQKSCLSAEGHFGRSFCDQTTWSIQKKKYHPSLRVCTVYANEIVTINV